MVAGYGSEEVAPMSERHWLYAFVRAYCAEHAGAEEEPDALVDAILEEERRRHPLIVGSWEGADDEPT
jgi:hypothetical protein